MSARMRLGLGLRLCCCEALDSADPVGCSRTGVCGAEENGVLLVLAPALGSRWMLGGRLSTLQPGGGSKPGELQREAMSAIRA